MSGRRDNLTLRQYLCAILHWLRWRESHLCGYHQNKDGSVDFYCWKCGANERVQKVSGGVSKPNQHLRGHLSYRYPPPYTVALVVVSMVVVLAVAALLVWAGR